MKKALTCLLCSVLIMIVGGLVVLASASNSCFRGQLLNYVVALVAFFVVVFVFNAHYLRQHWHWLVWGYLVLAIMLVACFFFKGVNGSHRWIMIPGLPQRIQPSEFAKIFCIIGTAVYLDIIGWRIRLFKQGLLPILCMVGLLAALIATEVDIGATMILLFTVGALLFLGGMNWILTLVGIGTVGMAVTAAVFLIPNRMVRLMSFITFQGDSADQLKMALVALQNGGIMGVGLNKSMQKLFYLPEFHTDFIFAIGAEELGLFFSLGVLLCFTVFFISGMYIAYKTEDTLGRYLVFGATLLIFVQCVANIAVVSGCIPTKGLALPFFSYGGTNLISTAMAVGLICNIARKNCLQKLRQRSKISTQFYNQTNRNN